MRKRPRASRKKSAHFQRNGYVCFMFAVFLAEISSRLSFFSTNLFHLQSTTFFQSKLFGHQLGVGGQTRQEQAIIRGRGRKPMSFCCDVRIFETKPNISCSLFLPWHTEAGSWPHIDKMDSWWRVGQSWWGCVTGLGRGESFSVAWERRWSPQCTVENI